MRNTSPRSNQNAFGQFHLEQTPRVVQAEDADERQQADSVRALRSSLIMSITGDEAVLQRPVALRQRRQHQFDKQQHIARARQAASAAA